MLLGTLLALACANPPPTRDLPAVEAPAEDPTPEDPADTEPDEPPDSEAPEDTEPAEPSYSVTWGPIPADLLAEMQGVTLHDGCPVPAEELALLEPAYWDFDGQAQTGRLVIAAVHAEALAGVFEALFDAKFPIRSMIPASAFGGSDDASMAADNTSAFNCRAITGGSSWSQHSYGHAIDINPIENPYVSSGGAVLPPEGAAYTDRADVRPGMAVEGDAVTAAFDAIGWGWGGRWSSLKDYQHFSANGK